jgi:hypothetical protein
VDENEIEEETALVGEGETPAEEEAAEEAAEVNPEAAPEE